MLRISSLLITVCLLLTTGCFSVMRIPVPSKHETTVDPVTLEPVTKVVEYSSCPNYPMCIYPSLHIRWHLLKSPFGTARDWSYRWDYLDHRSPRRSDSRHDRTALGLECIRHS